MSSSAFSTRRRIRVALILSTGAIAWTGLAAIAFAKATHPVLGDLSPTTTGEARLASVADGVAVFEWTGIFDMIGTGFPDGERRAVMAISRQDSAYALSMLQGPPGELKSLAVVGDSAHVVWNLGPEEMLIDLRGTGDSLVGVWSTGDWRGEVKGVRRR